MPSRKIEDCHALLRLAWDYASAKYKELHPNDPQPFLTCTHRTNEEQDALYAQGRTKPGKKVTNAKAGQSKHNSLPSMAFDIAFKNSDGTVNWDAKYFKKFADIVKQKGVKWGGDWTFKDLPHYEI